MVRPATRTAPILKIDHHSSVAVRLCVVFVEDLVNLRCVKYVSNSVSVNVACLIVGCIGASGGTSR